ncbi:MAG: InlB B-repeat-containing protein, partial [Acholeplasmataceae bacterium]
MKRFKKLTFGVLLLLMSLFFLKTHLFAGETITLTYVSYDTTKFHESDMPLFNPIFDGDDSVPFSTTESVVEEHRKGVEVFHIPNATAQHYSFNGWVYYDNGNEYILRRNDRFFKNTVFYARWTAIPKFVTYDLSGGVNNLGNTYLFNVRSTIELQPAYRAGHTFVDWVYYDEEAGADKVITHYENGSWWNKKVSPAVKVAESSPYDINIRATWAVNDYTISFDSNGGSAVASITASYGTTISAPTNPTREGYLFGGWYTSLSYDEEFTFTTMPAKDMTLYAKWDIEAYSIIYMSDGSTYYTLTQDYNTPILAPADPNKIGYTFGGWYTDAGCTTGNEFTLPAKMPAYDTTVYAKWTINKYDVSFSSDGAIVSTVNQNYGTTVTAPTISKTGYLLDGWYKEATHENKWNFETDTVPAKNTTLYAKWILCEYDVKFYDYESVLIKSDKVNYNNSATPPANDHARVVRSGYTFLGWHKEGETDLVDFSTFVVTEAVSFYPSYSLITYNITYDLGGATGTNPNPSTYNVETPTITLSTTGLTKTGYAFNNFKNAANDVITTIPKGSIGHMTIYLNWTLLSYTVSYVTDAPTSIDSHSQDYDTLITEPTISKVGYTLDGWYSDSSMSTLWVFASSKMPAANLTLYAKWTANTTTKYKVEHYFQRASDLTYVLYQTDTKTGTTDTNAVAVNLDHEGYTFNSTHADNLLEANINGDGSTVLKVHYTINQYSVTFFNEMVPIGSAQSVYYNEDATPPATDPTKTGHTFIGWNLDYTNVKADLYIFAQYEINQYPQILCPLYNGDFRQGLFRSPQSYYALKIPHRWLILP